MIITGRHLISRKVVEELDLALENGKNIDVRVKITEDQINTKIEVESLGEGDPMSDKDEEDIKNFIENNYK